MEEPPIWEAEGRPGNSRTYSPHVPSAENSRELLKLGLDVSEATVWPGLMTNGLRHSTNGGDPTSGRIFRMGD